MTRHLYRNSETIYCAENLRECWRLFTEDTGMTRMEEQEHDPFERIPDRELLDLASEEPYDEPGERHEARRQKNGAMGPYYWRMEKTAGEWAAISSPGHFSGGDY